MRRKPLLEILTFIIKRVRQAMVHLRDILRMIFGEIQLNNKQFFDKLSLKDPALRTVEKAVVQGDLEKAKKEIVTHMRIRDTPRFFFNRREKEKIMAILKEHFSQSKERTVDLAEEFVNHSFHFLGVNVEFDGNIDWRSSVTSSKRWPLTFSPNIDYFSPKRVGDIKLAWELNRTQHLVILGKAYWYTGDERYAIEFTNQLLSWIEENPYKIGINWMEGIEVAIRMISWVWAYYFFLDSEIFNEKGHFEFLKSIYMQTKFIEEHLSDKWQINNNHLIAEAAGLVLMGVMFPEFKEAEMWKKKGIAILEKELSSQVLPDGVTWEQSTGYHKFVADLCLLVVVLMMKNRMKIPLAVLLKLSQMIDFLNYITKTDGRMPLVGDDDQGRVTRITETAYDDARSTITIGSIIFNKKDWFRIESEEAFWLLGEEALTNVSKPVVPASRFFDESGFLVMRDKDKYLLFLVGPRNSKYLHASHRHLDMLSFVLDAHGTCFIVDPGTYTYFGDFKWRKYFKGIKAHNTVVVDDKDPVDIKEVFELSHVPFAKIQDYVTNDKFDWVIARHNGYKSVSHVREVFFVKPEYWIIIDLLEGDGEHVYDLYFHFDHGLDLRYDKAAESVTAMGSTGNLKISPLVTSGLNVKILEGEISPKYGVKVKAPILRYRKKGNTPAVFVTVLYPYKNDDPGIKVSQITVYGKDEKILKENEATGTKIDFEKHKDYFVCSHTGEQQYLSFENFRKRKGKIVYLRKEKMKAVKEVVF
jgi:hypothetical protein